MKKIAIILLVMASCSFDVVDDGGFGDFSAVPSSSSIVITGAHRSFVSSRTDLFWDRCRTYQGEDYTLNPANATIEASQSIIGIKAIRRVGLLFDISDVTALGAVTIDSAYLSIYNNGSSTSVGLAIYNAPHSVYMSGSYGDLTRATGCGGLDGVCFDLLQYNVSTSSGYNIYRVDQLPISESLWGDNYVSFGVGEYEHDYLDVKPSVNTSYEVEIDVDNINKPKLTIYYTVATPAANKPRITFIGD